MKYTLKNLLLFFKTEKMIFMLVLLCIITSSFVINFSYGMYQNYNKVKAEEMGELKEFVIDFRNTDSNYAAKKAVKNTLLSFSGELDDSVEMFYASYNLGGIFDEQSSGSTCRFRIENGKFAHSEAFRKNLETFGNLVSGEYLSDENEAGGERKALLGTDNRSGEYFRVNGKKLIFQGNEYEIIGVTGLDPIIVPFDSLADDTRMKDMGFYFKNNMTRRQYNEIKEKVRANFGELADIPELDIPETENYYLYNTIILISVLIALLASVNFSVLYKYILSKRVKTLAVFRICGCTKARAFRMFLSECMLITIPVFSLTTLIYDKCALPVLAGRFEYIRSAYSTELYLLISAIYIISSIAVLGIMIYSGFMNRSIREAKGVN